MWVIGVIIVLFVIAAFIDLPSVIGAIANGERLESGQILAIVIVGIVLVLIISFIIWVIIEKEGERRERNLLDRLPEGSRGRCSKCDCGSVRIIKNLKFFDYDVYTCRKCGNRWCAEKFIYSPSATDIWFD